MGKMGKKNQNMQNVHQFFFLHSIDFSEEKNKPQHRSIDRLID